MQDGANAARPTVLAVDDEPTVRYALGLVLDDHCDLLLAPDGPSALDLLSSHRVDIVLLDLLMPNMHGLDVLPRLLAADPTLIVVILTAIAAAASVVKAMKLGAWNYVTKPWENEQLLELINRTAHAAALTALVETPSGYRFYLGVYVRRVSRFTPIYMALIYPFRKLIVYPSLLRTVRLKWNEMKHSAQDECAILGADVPPTNRGQFDDKQLPRLP